MLRAPAVSFLVGRSRWHLGCVALFSLLALVVTAIFLHGQAQLDWRSAALVVALIAGGALAVQGWRHSPTGELRWDGQHWHWTAFGAEQNCRLSLLVDFQAVVLVALVAGSRRPVWLWLEAAHGVGNWAPLRRAIVSSLRHREGVAASELTGQGKQA